MTDRDSTYRNSTIDHHANGHPLNDDHPNDDHPNDDHWEMFAEAMDLTIEGHRLIAREIGYEAKQLWLAVTSWLRQWIGTSTRRGASPPV
jgi:hypothetical protein